MTKEEVLKIVDMCFHAYASFYREDARQEAEDLIKELEDEQGQTLPIASVSKHRELLIAYELENWEGSDVLLEAVEARVDQYLSNL